MKKKFKNYFQNNLNFRAQIMKWIEVFLKLFQFSRQNNEINWSVFEIIWFFAPKLFHFGQNPI